MLTAYERLLLIGTSDMADEFNCLTIDRQLPSSDFCFVCIRCIEML